MPIIDDIRRFNGGGKKQIIHNAVDVIDRFGSFPLNIQSLTETGLKNDAHFWQNVFRRYDTIRLNHTLTYSFVYFSRVGIYQRVIQGGASKGILVHGLKNSCCCGTGLLVLYLKSRAN